MEHALVADIAEIEQLLARYAVGMTKDDVEAVSYTHLTLPTNREV